MNKNTTADREQLQTMPRKQGVGMLCASSVSMPHRDNDRRVSPMKSSSAPSSQSKHCRDNTAWGDVATRKNVSFHTGASDLRTQCV